MRSGHFKEKSFWLSTPGGTCIGRIGASMLRQGRLQFDDCLVIWD